MPTLASQRGAVCRKAGVKRMPSATPMNSWARLLIHRGSADGSMPSAVSTKATASGPSIQAFDRRAACIAQPPSAVSATSTSRPPGCTTCGPGKVASRPCSPAHWKPNGTTSTTIRSRSECALATRSSRPPWRSASTAISEAPPIALAKNTVGRSSAGLPALAHCRKAPKPAPSSKAQAMPTAIAGASDHTMPTTCGVKYRPSAVPMAH